MKEAGCEAGSDLSRFIPRFDRLFLGEALNPILVNKMQDKNKEVTANPKFQTLKKNWFFENSKS